MYNIPPITNIISPIYSHHPGAPSRTRSMDTDNAEAHDKKERFPYSTTKGVLNYHKIGINITSKPRHSPTTTTTHHHYHLPFQNTKQEGKSATDRQMNEWRWRGGLVLTAVRAKLVEPLWALTLGIPSLLTLPSSMQMITTKYRTMLLLPMYCCQSSDELFYLRYHRCSVLIICRPDHL